MTNINKTNYVAAVDVIERPLTKGCERIKVQAYSFCDMAVAIEHYVKEGWSLVTGNIGEHPISVGTRHEVLFEKSLVSGGDVPSLTDTSVVYVEDTEALSDEEVCPTKSEEYMKILAKQDKNALIKYAKEFKISLSKRGGFDTISSKFEKAYKTSQEATQTNV